MARLVIKADASDGATTGSIVVTFTGGSEDGAASAVLMVTDKSNQTGSATAVINVNEEETIIPVTG